MAPNANVECLLPMLPSVLNSHADECHERLLNGYELGNPKTPVVYYRIQPWSFVALQSRP